MDVLGLFWNFDANNNTKIIVFIVVVVIVLCILCKPKNKKKKADNFTNNNKLSKCQIDYKTCQENKKRGNIKNMCQVCKTNGDYPDRIYNNTQGWIKIDPKNGKPLK